MLQNESPWLPSLFTKQQEIFNLGTQQEAGDVHPECATAALICGPRESGKTLAVIHRLARHLWETPGAMTAIVHKTTKNVTNSGVANDITRIVFPEWIYANIGFNYTTFDRDGIPGWKTDGPTRTPYLRVSNMYGGESEIRVLPVEHDCEIQQKLKSSRWTMIWLNELANFKDPQILTMSYELLRWPYLKKWQHLWIADTNPALEGEDSWIYKFWYLKDWSALQFAHDPAKKADNQQHVDRLKGALKLIEVFLEDNFALTPAEISIKKALHQGDPGEYAREVEGRWIKGSGGRNRHFSDLFSREIHLIEENPQAGERMELSASTTDLFVGWDLGSSVNHGVVFLEKRIVSIGDKEWPIWTALREIEAIGERLKLSEIGEMAVSFMDELQKLYERPLGFQHWSDDSALNTFRPTGEGYDYLEIQAATAGRILMRGVFKPKGSIETRIRLLRRLLREKRFYVSSQCPAVIAMLENAARGTKLDDKVTGTHKHIFDSLTYPMFMESAGELADLVFKPSTSKSQLVSMRL